MLRVDWPFGSSSEQYRPVTDQRKEEGKTRREKNNERIDEEGAELSDGTRAKPTQADRARFLLILGSAR